MFKHHLTIQVYTEIQDNLIFLIKKIYFHNFVKIVPCDIHYLSPIQWNFAQKLRQHNVKTFYYDPTAYSKYIIAIFSLRKQIFLQVSKNLILWRKSQKPGSLIWEKKENLIFSPSIPSLFLFTCTHMFSDGINVKYARKIQNTHILSCDISGCPLILCLLNHLIF